jgi:hypothetical protein
MNRVAQIYPRALDSCPLCLSYSYAYKRVETSITAWNAVLLFPTSSQVATWSIPERSHVLAAGPKQRGRSTADHLPRVVSGIRDSTLLSYPERLLLVSCGVGYSSGKGVAGRNLNFVNPPGGSTSQHKITFPPLSRDAETSEAYCTKTWGWVRDPLVCVLRRKTQRAHSPFQTKLRDADNVCFPYTCTKSLISSGD